MCAVHPSLRALLPASVLEPSPVCLSSWLSLGIIPPKATQAGLAAVVGQSSSRAPQLDPWAPLWAPCPSRLGHQRGPSLPSRSEEYVDQCYKEYLKNQGKVDSVRMDLSGVEGQDQRVPLGAVPAWGWARGLGLGSPRGWRLCASIRLEHRRVSVGWGRCGLH